MLEQLKYTECPVCKARVKSFTKKDKHCNGHWNEVLEFDCGWNNCIISWSPNFMSEKLERPCPNAHKLFVELKNKK